MQYFRVNIIQTLLRRIVFGNAGNFQKMSPKRLHATNLLISKIKFNKKFVVNFHRIPTITKMFLTHHATLKVNSRTSIYEMIKRAHYASTKVFLSFLSKSLSQPKIPAVAIKATFTGVRNIQYCWLENRMKKILGKSFISVQFLDSSFKFGSF